MTTEQDSAAVEERVRDLLHSDDVESAREVLLAMHPADQADLFDSLDDDERQTMLSLLDADGVAALLEHMDEDLRKGVAEKTPRGALAQILDRMENDIAVDILHDMAPAEASLTLAHMRTAAEILPLMQHSDETAGGIMTRGYIALHKDMTAEEALAFLRATKPLAEEAYYLYVLDGQNHLQGVVSLRQLVVSEPQTRLEDVMVTDVVSVAPDTDQEEAARLLQRYRLRSLPVVDADGVLSGIITADDIIDVIQEEATEDMYRMAGVGVKEWVFSPLRESIIRRVPWLSFNMIWAFAGAAVISLFQGTLEKAAVVAVFMPMIAGQAGNAGIQTATIVVRSMALGEVKLNDITRVLAKEIALAATKGVIFGSALGLIAWVWKGNIYLGLIAGSALFLNMLIAGTAGVLIPMTLRRLGLDPATIAGVFDTMLTDLMGFLIYLGLATIFISQLT
jgi:magnesium transporter